MTTIGLGKKMVVLVYFKTLLFKVKSNQIPPNYNYNFKKLSKLYNYITCENYCHYNFLDNL